MEVNLSRGMPLQYEGSQVFSVQDLFAPEPLLKYMCHGHTFLFLSIHTYSYLSTFLFNLSDSSHGLPYLSGPPLLSSEHEPKLIGL